MTEAEAISGLDADKAESEALTESVSATFSDFDSTVSSLEASLAVQSARIEEFSSNLEYATKTLLPE